MTAHVWVVEIKDGDDPAFLPTGVAHLSRRNARYDAAVKNLQHKRTLRRYRVTKYVREEERRDLRTLAGKLAAYIDHPDLDSDGQALVTAARAAGLLEDKQ